MGNKKREKFLKNHENNNKDALKGINDLYPKFSFEYCFNGKRGIDKIQDQVKKALVDKLTMLSQRTWQDIKALGKERGLEKIDKKYFNNTAGIPNKFKDENKISIFRLNQEMGRLIGYIEGETFFIVWIDTEYNMYNH